MLLTLLLVACTPPEGPAASSGEPGDSETEVAAQECEESVVVEGPVAVTSDEDALALCANRCEVTIVGNLSVSGITDAADLSCVVVTTGTIRVFSAPITDLDVLSGLMVAGYLWVEHTQIGSLAGLDRLVDIRDGFLLDDNALLSTLDGLGSLRLPPTDLVSIRGSPLLPSLGGAPETLFAAESCFFWFSDNGLTSLDVFAGREELPAIAVSDPVLADLGSLRSATRIAGSLSLSNLPQLTSLDGLSALQWVDGTIYMRNLEITSLQPFAELRSITGPLSLNDLPLTDLRGLAQVSLLGGLQITHLPAITSLAGLESVTTLSTGVSIAHNASLASLDGLDALVTVAERVAIQLNPKLATLRGLGALTSVLGLRVEANDALRSFEGLESLESVGGYGLAIQTNPALESLAGLERLEVVEGHFSIGGNESLTSLAGLSALRVVGGNVFIAGNAMLPQAEAEAFAAGLDVQGSITVRDNGE